MPTSVSRWHLSRAMLIMKHLCHCRVAGAQMEGTVFSYGTASRWNKTGGGLASMGEVQIQKVFLDALQEQLAMLQKTVNKLTEQNRKKDECICELEQMLLNAQRARFGQRSEKRVYVLEDGTEQLSMFGAEETAAGKSETQDEQLDGSPNDSAGSMADDNGEIEVCAHTRKPKRTLEELCKNLPVEERIIDLPEEEKVSANGKPLICIGTEPIRTEIEVERTRARVVKYFLKVYKYEEFAREYGDTPIITPATPVPHLPHSYLSRTLATDVLIRKYADALPLYRQEQIW